METIKTTPQGDLEVKSDTLANRKALDTWIKLLLSSPNGIIPSPRYCNLKIVKFQLSIIFSRHPKSFFFALLDNFTKCRIIY